ncbi:hypothetical protein SEA_HAUNTER_68 [Microbacterium phage Haunter]|nr:hypothetical protein SEA_HAUNTER_68 [Microbacterium phage Haunter]
MDPIEEVAKVIAQTHPAESLGGMATAILKRLRELGALKEDFEF